MKCRIEHYALDGEALIMLKDAQLKRQYRCPKCYQMIGVRQGSMRKKHFYHLDYSPSTKHDFSAHVQLQKLLLNCCEQLQLSCNCEETISVHRYDVVIYDTKRIIEIQRTNLSFDHVISRIRVAREYGFTLLWLFEQTELRQQMVQLFSFVSWQEKIIVSMRNNNIVFHDGMQQFVQLYWWIKISNSRCLVVVIPITLEEIVTTHVAPPVSSCIAHQCVAMFKQQLHLWQRLFQYKRKREDLLCQLLYQEQIQIGNIPLSCYSCKYPLTFLKHAVFWNQALIYLLVIYQQQQLDGVIAFYQAHDLYVLESIRESDIHELTQFMLYLKQVTTPI